QSLTCLGLEYFCTEGDDLWRMRDEDLLALGRREVEAIGVLQGARVIDWTARLTNLQLVGRNGMHKYNNQDHSMLTARLAVRNLFGERHDLWAVNADEEYHEEEDLRALAASQPLVPQRIHTERRA